MVQGEHQGTAGRLRAVREVQRKSLRATARDAGVAPSYLSRVERGLQTPSIDVLMRLGRVLGLDDLVETVELFVEEPAKPSDGGLGHV